jgi:hypothetical protein
MSRSSSAPPIKGTPDTRFRGQITAALAEGVKPADMTLRLTYADATAMTRDKATPVADISYTGGVMRFLGVRVEKGGVDASALDRGAS